MVPLQPQTDRVQSTVLCFGRWRLVDPAEEIFEGIGINLFAVKHRIMRLLFGGGDLFDCDRNFRHGR
jgi:hypothetical protein